MRGEVIIPINQNEAEWQMYVRQCKESMEKAKREDELGHTEVASRRMQEAMVLSNLAVVSVIMEEDDDVS
jgi:DNA-directed RNA polymerase subunit N (RpoN/RPB10)